MANNNPNYKPKLNQPVILKYIPHGIDEKSFFPLTVENQGEILKKDNKEITQFQDMVEFKKSLFANKEYDFVIFFNNRNIRRKMPGDIILSYEHFLQKLQQEEKEKCILILHTTVSDENGTDLFAVKEAVSPTSNIIFSNNRIDIVQMNYFYNIADVTINIASNEGFGLGTAESLMAGTPIIVNVTGGLQDQCGFVDENNIFINPDLHFGKDWPSNHDGKYKNHGNWVTPLFPTNRALAGSPQTPYIFDDRCRFEDAADALYYWYKLERSKRKECGLNGRAFMMETGMTAIKMGVSFIDYIDYTLDNYTPKKRFFIKEI